MSSTVTATICTTGCCDCCARELKFHWQAIESLIEFRRTLSRHGSVECDPEIRRLREDVEQIKNGDDEDGDGKDKVDVNSELSKLKDEIAQLHHERNQDYESIKRLQQARQQEQEEFERWRRSLRREINEMRTEISSMSVLELSIAELKDKVASLETEVAQLKSRTGSTSSGYDQQHPSFEILLSVIVSRYERLQRRRLRREVRRRSSSCSYLVKSYMACKLPCLRRQRARTSECRSTWKARRHCYSEESSMLIDC
jgi:chromosome segregation ATPase